MATIKHRVHFMSSPDKVFQAITTKAGLESWWTSDVEITEDGKGYTFGFNNHSVLIKMRLDQKVNDQFIEWKCQGEPEEWIDTRVRFEISELDNGRVQLDFTHSNWQSDKKDFPKCNTDWGHLMYYLKDYVEGRNNKAFMK